MPIETIKRRAREQLGGNIFAREWLYGVLCVLIISAIQSVAGNMGIIGLVIIGPLSFGYSYVFLKHARDGEEIKIADLFSGFSEDFLTTFLIGLMSAIFTLLWSLLFIIPGIVKTYSYSFAYYIKIDHPDYNWAECIKKSKALTYGHKLDIFWLDLTFIGWYILGSLCLGVGTLWVSAYHSAAKAQMYDSIKSAADYTQSQTEQ